MKITVLVSQTSENYKIRAYNCKAYKNVKIGSLYCQECKHFNGGDCTHKKNN